MTASMTRAIILACIFALTVSLGGCPSSQSSTNQNDNSSSTATNVVGVWQCTSGELVAGDTSELKYLELDTDGSAAVYLQDPDTYALTCYSGIFTQPSNTAMLLSADGLTDGSELLLIEQPAADTLTLTSDDAEADFARGTAVPDDLLCREFTVKNTFEGLPSPGSWTGLVNDGTQLWYTVDSTDALQPVNPTTGAPGTQVVFSTAYQQLQAYEAGAFWLHCACGGSQDAQLLTATETLVDQLDTGTDLGDEISIRSIAANPAQHVLWIFGDGATDGKNRVLTVDSSTKTVLATHYFEPIVTGMTWDGTHLWLVVAPSLQSALKSGPQWILEVDPTTCKAVHTYATPNSQVRWQAVASNGSTLFLLGSKSGAGVLVEVEP
jgi:hypothetical protein